MSSSLAKPEKDPTTRPNAGAAHECPTNVFVETTLCAPSPTDPLRSPPTAGPSAFTGDEIGVLIRIRRLCGGGGRTNEHGGGREGRGHQLHDDGIAGSSRRYARRTNTTRERSPTASTARAPIAGPPGHAQALTSSVGGGGNTTRTTMAAAATVAAAAEPT